MEIKRISIENLEKLIDQQEDFLLIDVLPPEYYNQEHIVGAKNAPVYEIAFLEHVGKLTDDKNKHIVLYNESEDSLATEDAGAKLLEAGYLNVEIFPGGLNIWKEAGHLTEKGEQVKDVRMEDGEYVLDIKSSAINWIGRNAKYAHRGKINIQTGKLKFEKGKIASGEIVIDMQSIQDEDLSDMGLRSVLEGHLKSSDFFNVAKFPQAKFVFAKSDSIASAKKGTPNFHILGSFELKGIDREIEFDAMITPTEQGVVSGQAHFDLDRTLWNVRYGSEKFFEKLGMHLVNDIISLDMFLVAKK